MPLFMIIALWVHIWLTPFSNKGEREDYEE
jgi:hypothetical protein